MNAAQEYVEPPLFEMDGPTVTPDEHPGTERARSAWDESVYRTVDIDVGPDPAPRLVRAVERAARRAVERAARRAGSGVRMPDPQPDPRVSTSLEWAQVARSQYAHYRKIADAWDPSREIALRHHQRVTADLVPHLVAQIEHLWTEFEVWVKWWRDQYPTYGREWHPVNSMLDDLREHLAEGAPLHRPSGSHAEEAKEDRWTPSAWTSDPGGA